LHAAAHSLATGTIENSSFADNINLEGIADFEEICGQLLFCQRVSVRDFACPAINSGGEVVSGCG
jgi:hypothetical protein